MEKQIKTYKTWSHVFLIIGLISLFDVGTKSIVQSMVGSNLDFGLISFWSLLLFKYLFGVRIAAILTTVISLIMGLSLLWFVPAYALNKRAKAIENPNEENVKKFKRAKIIAWVFGGIFIAVMLFGMFSVFFAVSNQ